MYYRSVNRGVFLTSPGKYTIALVLALGFIAIASSYNGIYLAVSLGMAILIVSGLLSEKVMKHYKLEKLLPVIAEPRTPFSIRMTATNESREVTLYGVENLVIPAPEKTPKISERLTPLMRATVLVLPPGRSQEVSGTCFGLTRGFYSDFLVVQRTLFPFGLLAKFKLSRISARVMILPSFDEKLADLLRDEMQRRIAGLGIDQQFHSHRPFTSRDSLRSVDWKKSAGRLQQNWVIKVFESFIEEFGVLLELDWDVARLLPAEEGYERHLSRLRTACDIVQESGRRLAITDGLGRIWDGYDECVATLIRAPKFAERRKTRPTASNSLSSLPGTFVRLSITTEVPQWGATHVRSHA